MIDCFCFFSFKHFNCFLSEATRKLKNKKLDRLWKFAAKSGAIKNLEDEFAFRQFDNNVFVKNEMSVLAATLYWVIF